MAKNVNICFSQPLLSNPIRTTEKKNISSQSQNNSNMEILTGLAIPLAGRGVAEPAR